MATLKYDVESKPYIVLKGKISAPKFQRNFVWKKKARKELINSIKQGLPIGSFLLQRIDNDQFNIIDGRQRFSTLLDYEAHRYEYIDESDISEDKIIDILLGINEIETVFMQYNERAQKKIITDIKKVALKQLRTKDTDKSNVTFEIIDAIKLKFSSLSKNAQRQLNSAVNKFYDDIWQILDTTNVVLPCIIFNQFATDDEIVATFINLNTRGTKLSKYDLYSAKWQNDVIVIDDDSIIDKVISKYKDSLENNQNIEVESFNEIEIRATKQINVFEYAYALSKLIGERCNKIYQTKEASEVDSLGFSILASLLNVPSKNMADLSKKLIDSHINLVALKDKIISCAKEIENTLEWYCISPDATNYFNHTYNQLVSYIVTYFKAKYEITSDGRIVDNSMKGKLKEFKVYLPLWYLYDNIRGFWLGSGDTKLDKLVLTDDIFSSPYFSKVSENSFRISLQDWLTNENMERNPSVKPESKLFINYVIKKRCSEPHNGMEIEHIIPQVRLELLASREKSVTGISSPSNLTLIPKFDNRSKREKTYYELVDLRDNSAMTYDPAQLDKYLYPEHVEIKFIESQSEFTVAKFNQFKKDRTNTLINTFISEYY